MAESQELLICHAGLCLADIGPNDSPGSETPFLLLSKGNDNIEN